MRTAFTLTLTDGTVITDEPKGGDTAPADIRIEPYGVEIVGNGPSNWRHIPWHRIADVTIRTVWGSDPDDEDGAR